MRFVGENFIKPDMDEIKKRSKYIEFDDEEDRVWWVLIYDWEMYFLFKRERQDDEPHEGEGIAITDDVYEVCEEIKEFYDLQENEINKNLSKDHMIRILRFLDEILNIDGIKPGTFDHGIEKMKRDLNKK